MFEREEINGNNSDGGKWFFIIGCQRSGTTLIRLVLECHSHIECWDERIAYDVLAGRVHKAVSRRLVGLKVPCLTEQFGCDRIQDPFVNLDVPNPYRGQKLIFMVRDVRDTVLSMLRHSIQNVPWVNARVITTLRAKIRSEAEFAERYGGLFESAKKAQYPGIACAALYWRYKVEALFAYLLRYPVLPVRYEDLTLRPERELRRICAFIDVPWDPALLSHPEFNHGELSFDGKAIGDTDPMRCIDSTSVNRWLEAFNAAQLDAIMETAGIAQSLFYPAPIPLTSHQGSE